MRKYGIIIDRCINTTNTALIVRHNTGPKLLNMQCTIGGWALIGTLHTGLCMVWETSNEYNEYL